MATGNPSPAATVPIGLRFSSEMLAVVVADETLDKFDMSLPP